MFFGANGGLASLMASLTSLMATSASYDFAGVVLTQCFDAISLLFASEGYSQRVIYTGGGSGKTQQCVVLTPPRQGGATRGVFTPQNRITVNIVQFAYDENF